VIQTNHLTLQSNNYLDSKPCEPSTIYW